MLGSPFGQDSQTEVTLGYNIFLQLAKVLEWFQTFSSDSVFYFSQVYIYFRSTQHFALQSS